MNANSTLCETEAKEKSINGQMRQLYSDFPTNRHKRHETRSTLYIAIISVFETKINFVLLRVTSYIYFEFSLIRWTSKQFWILICKLGKSFVYSWTSMGFERLHYLLHTSSLRYCALTGISATEISCKLQFDYFLSEIKMILIINWIWSPCLIGCSALDFHREWIRVHDSSRARERIYC